LPHTADTRIEAWAQTREACIAEAVRSLLDMFADTAAMRPQRTAEVSVPAGSDADMLVAVLDEVIYRLDVDGELALYADVAAAPGGGLRVRLSLGNAALAEETGAVPKAVSLHDLRFTGGASGWSCAVTVDV
jgi:SHS2 domain-containing protein